MSNWTNEPQPFGANHTPLLTGLSSIDGITPVPVAVDPATGKMLTSASGGSAGTQYAEGATTAPGTGNLSLGRYKATPPSLTDGQLYGLQLDTSGNLKVTGSLSVGGTTDNSAFTAGTSTGTPAMGFYHSTIDAVTDGRSAAVAITANRAQHSNLRNASGTEIGTASTPVQISLANTGANATAVKVDGSAVTQPVSGTFWQATQPVSGTVTANIGTTNGLALDASVTGLQVAQASTTSGQKGGLILGAVTTSAPSYTTAQTSPLSLDTSGNLRMSVNNTVTVSGTVTANAGTNLNTSLLALESGGNLATLAGTVTSSVMQGNIKQINGVTPLMGNGVTGTGSQRVTIASDNTAFAVNATLQTGANAIGSITNTSFAATQATASSLNATVVGTGTFAVQAAGDVASGSSDSGNPVKQGAVAHTAAPTAVTDGQRVNIIADKVGKLVAVGSIRDLKVNTPTSLASTTSETTVLAAVAATFLDVYGVILANGSATGVSVAFKDSTTGTTQFKIYVPAGETRGFMLPESGAIKQGTVNNNWTATPSGSVTPLDVTMLAVKNI